MIVFTLIGYAIALVLGAAAGWALAWTVWTLGVWLRSLLASRGGTP